VPEPDAPTPSIVQTILADRIVTVPNALSFGRLLAIPFFLQLLFGQDDPAAAAALLAVLGFTDWLDGQVARRFNQVSELGVVLDPLSDRVLLIVVVVSTMVSGAVPLWYGIPVLLREPVILIAAVIVGLLGAKPLAVTWWGKVGTAGLLFAFPLLLLGDSTASVAPVARAAGWMFGIPGLVISYWAAISYIPLARSALREGRGAAST
jgi:cardiolipin synthase